MGRSSFSREKRNSAKKVFFYVLLCFSFLVVYHHTGPVIIRKPSAISCKVGKAIIIFSSNDLRTIHPRMRKTKCLVCKNESDVKRILSMLDKMEGSGDVATCESRLYFSFDERVIGLVLDEHVLGLQIPDKGWVEIEPQSELFELFCSFKPSYSPIVFY